MTSTDSSDTTPKSSPSPDPGDIDRALDRISADAAGDDAEPVEAGPRRPVLLALGAIGAVVFLWMLFRPIPHEDTATAPTAPPSADAVDRMATDADPGWMRNADTARFLPGGAPMVPPVFGEDAGAQPRAAGDTSAAALPDSAGGASTGAGAVSPAETADPRREAFRAALKSKPLGSASPLGLTFSESDAEAPLTPAPSYAEMAAAAETEAAARTPGATQLDTGEAPGARGAVGSSYVSGGTGDPPRLAAPARLAPRTVTGPDRAATLAIGTVIEGQLAVSINSDLPGGAIGVVTRPVYDVSLRHEVIPAGSWLYGTYESAIVAGQGRLVLQWTAIRFPDGRTYELPALRAGDGTGASGIPGRVNNHYGRVFGQALLSSVIAAGFTSGSSASAGSQPSRRDALADAAASQLGETAAQVTRRNLSIKPTITVPRLTPFTIMLDRELTFLPASR
jgi:type IV secretory pathway VirB10-like protein